MDSFYISTWNVEGKGSPEEIDTILSNSSQIKSELKPLQIVCVQQANFPSSGESKNYKWLCSGTFGSAVLVNKASPRKTNSFEQVCEQICVAQFESVLGRVVNVISCYIPPSADYVTRDLWPKLGEIIKTLPCWKQSYILAGDFNAEIGGGDTFPYGIDRGIIGPKLYHKSSNENGIQLRKLTLNSHSALTNTFGMPDSSVKLYTYDNGEVKSQRSFIVVPSDRFPFNQRPLMYEHIVFSNPDYKSSVLSKSIKFTLQEQFLKLLDSEVVVSSWNIQGASPSAVDRVLADYALPLMCVQDVFLTSDLDLETENYTWYTSKKLWGKNVGILIKKSSDILMANFEVISEYLCAGDITFNGCTIKVICCCVPPHTDFGKFQEATEKLTNLVKSIPKETLYVVAGDFNTNISYTMLEDPLVFDEGDGNGLFMQRFVQDCDLELEHTNKSIGTQASEKIRRNTSHVLMSAGCMLKYSQKRYVRWVPFYEHGIVIVFLPEYDVDVGQSAFSNNEVKRKKQNKFEKVEDKDGFKYITKRFCTMRKYFSAPTHEFLAFRFLSPELMSKSKPATSSLPKRIIAKYKDTPPPMKELLRILGNAFTLYYGFLKDSTLPSGCMNVLTTSFECLGRGLMVAECIDVFEEKTNIPVKRIIKFRWNGIIVHQYEGGKFVNYKLLINKAQKDFISKLGQRCFTVKAKASFYNNGLPPLCQDQSKIDEVVRVMKREDFSPTATVEDVKKVISKFFVGDTYLDLVFGPDFSHKQFLEPIKKYALSKNLWVRWFKSRKDLKTYDHLCIFIYRSPKALRKRLLGISDHQDLKFQLFPRCGTEKNYFDWIDEWAEKPIPEEYYKRYKKVTETKTASVTNAVTQDGNKPLDAGQVVQTEGERAKRNVGFKQKVMRYIGGSVTSKILSCANLSTSNPTPMLPKGPRHWIAKAREETDLPQEVVTKYCETAIPINDFVSILGDEFILFYGFGQKSSVVRNSMEVLSESFEFINRGGIMMENVELLRKKGPFKRLVKFKWNAICIHEEEGRLNQSFKNISRAGQLALIDKLGRHCYAIKAKISYYNNGLPPQCEDKEKLKEVLRMVKKEEFSSTCSMDEVKTFISEFFLQDTTIELVFGDDFSHDMFLEPIKLYAKEKDLGYRWFKSTEKSAQWDNISVFKKRSPLELCDGLRDLPDNHDLKFFLVPPCEFSNKCHYDWVKHWAGEILPEEFKLMVERDTMISSAQKQKPKATVNTAGQKPSLQQANYNDKSSQSKPRRSAAQIRKLQQRYQYRQQQRAGQYRDQQRGDQYRDQQRGDQYRDQQRVDQYREQQREDWYREESRFQPSRSEQQYRDYVWERAGDYRGSSPLQSIRPEGYDRSSISLKVFDEIARYQEPAGRKRTWDEMDYYEEGSRSQPYRSDDYGRSSDPPNRYENEEYDAGIWFGDEAHNTQPERYTPKSRRERQQPMHNTPGERYAPQSKRARQQPMHNTSGERYAPQNKRARQQDMHNTSGERYVPESKRARTQPLPKADKPRWDEIGPLVIVWPISMRSENERDARKVLEANFPTEISLESNNRAAVYVTLPLRKTRREKTYCLCIGNSVNSATRIALDLIVKHGSVIKYNPNYLPQDGLVPNFIRYNVPCQTNPRTYITLGWMDTGPLTVQKIDELFGSFKGSFNEDLFFDKDNYSHEEKLMLLDMAPKYGLKVRHFGVDIKLVNRYVCVYKTKPKDDILEEVLRMRDFHPKYRLVTNKLPPRLGLNIY